jgi:hypothetical protein
MGMGSSIGSGAVTGAATGAGFGPIGLGIGAVVGGFAGFLAEKQDQENQQKIMELIKNTPDYTKSSAYANAASQAGRADRFAQQGLSGQEYENMGQDIQRTGGQAISQAETLQSGLLGMSGVQRSMQDAYLKRLALDNQVKREQQQQAIMANQNFQNVQDEAFSIELGKNANMMNLAAGNLASDKADMSNAMESGMTGVQNYLNSSSALGGKISNNYTPFGRKPVNTGGSKVADNTGLEMKEVPFTPTNYFDPNIFGGGFSQTLFNK